MVRGAAIGFVVSMLLTTVAAWLMLTGTVHAQRAPQHVFSGSVKNAGTPIWQGQVSFQDMSGNEVANGNVNNGRYKIAVVEPAGRNYSGQALRISVAFQQRIYERGRLENWQAGGVTVLDLEFGSGGGWKWHQAVSQADQQRMDQNNEDRARKLEEDRRRLDQNDEERARRSEMDNQRMEMDRQRMEMEEEMRREQMEMERQRMGMEGNMREKEGEERREMEEEMRREQMEMERQRMEREDKMREKEGEERREMERQRMEREDEDRARRMKMDEQRMEREEELRREQMQMERQRMERGQPGVRPVAGESPKSGPSRGLFSNRAAGEATSGIDNIMDPTMLTIIGIALTVFTTGMTLFKGN